MNALRFCLFTASITLAVQWVSAQDAYRFKHFDSKDGLADDYANSLQQDSLGYIWVQYYAGLSRFDGFAFRTYKYDREDSRLSSLNFALGKIHADKHRNIWVTQHQFHPAAIFTIARYDRHLDGFRKFAGDLDPAMINGYRIDHNGHSLWLNMREGKGLRALDLQTNTYREYINPSADPNLHRLRNTVFDSEDRGAFILIATLDGLWNLDKRSGEFSRPACHPKDSSMLFHRPIYFIGPEDHFWIAVNGSLVRLGKDLSTRESIKFPANFGFTSFSFAPDGLVWFGTANGLCRVDPSDGSFTYIRHVPGDPYSLRSNTINDVLVDRDNNVWVATPKGISRMLPQSLKFKNVDLEVGGFTIYQANDRDMLVISQTGTSGNLKRILMAPIIPAQIERLQFEELLQVRGNDHPWFYPGKKHFWITTRVQGSGIYGLPVDKESGTIRNDKVVRFQHDPTNSGTIGSNDIGALWEDAHGDLWVGNNGLTKIDLRVRYGDPGSVVNFGYADSDTNSVHIRRPNKIQVAGENSLWLMGPVNIDLFHRDTEQVDHIFADREMVRTLFTASDGLIYVGTSTGLCKTSREGDRIVVDAVPVWSKAEITAIQEDRLGRLWLYSKIGPVCFDPKENIAIEFNEDDGALHNNVVEAGYLKQTSGGLMVMADPYGLSVFDPLSLAIDRKKIRPVLTDLYVNNHRLKVGAEDFTASADVSVLEELAIDHRHNNIAIQFSAMEMTAPEKNLYRHKLDGYDKDWIESDFRNRTATFTNLDAGTYTFRVKASNHHGIWSDEESTLTITVLPPPWRSTWAYAGYGITFVLLLYAARRNLLQREQLKANLRIAQVEREKERFELEKAIEVDKVKSNFFTNISHEFRTPLTLIKGPIQEIMDEFSKQPRVVERLTLAQRNADVVLGLINQLLDLAKLESGTVTVDESTSDINSLVHDVVNSFSSQAQHKRISLTVALPATRYHMRFDKGKVETILTNLVNNAIKFTPPDGLVRVHVAAPENENKVIISVSDSGIGIPADQQKKVFERFHQVSETHKELGTGIGLALVMELTTLLRGHVRLNSSPGKGSEFIVMLPFERVHAPRPDERALHLEAVSGHEVIMPVSARSEASDHRPHVLVVEDNDDLRKFIIESLGKEYHFLEASDGNTGLQTAMNEVPDLVISDIMMPEMDGIVMTGKIKKDVRTSHIPVILLTARISEDSKMLGLEMGADDYLSKPFNRSELQLKVRNGIAGRVKLREKVRLELLKEGPAVDVQSADEKFLLRVKDTILSRLNDDQLGVETLAADIGLSRSQLLRKVTALTGSSVNELIRTFRLQRAAQLLERNWGPVTQVAYEVGFSNLSYFSKVFKEAYGVLPSEYGEKTGRIA